MKNLITTFCLLCSSIALAETKAPEKTIEIKAHIVKMTMTSKNIYRLELRELAAAYHAEEKFVACLQKAMKENKAATLKVTAYSLLVQECRVD